MPAIIVVDTSSLIDLAQAGIGSGGSPTTFLNDLLTSGNTIVVNSVVYQEATRGAYPDALIIRNWLDQHTASGQIVFHDLGPDLTNHYLSMPDGGEMSIVERTAVDPSVVGLGDDVRILTRDASFLNADWWQNSPFNQADNLFDSLDMYGERFVNGGLQADDWARGMDYLRGVAAAGRNIDNPISSALSKAGDLFRKMLADESGTFRLSGLPEFSWNDLPTITKAQMFGIAGEAVGVAAILVDSYLTRQEIVEALANGDLRTADELLGGLIGRSFGGAFAAALSGAYGGAWLGWPGAIGGAILGGIFGGLAGGEIGSWLFGELNDAGLSMINLLDGLQDLLGNILADPLVLDLDGDGVELVPLASSLTMFDLDGDGVAERAGWVSPHDGLLVHDANGNGVVDGVAELFGSANVDGFDELRTLDSNADGRIDASDAAFAQLRVWRDLNSDGASSPNEILTLADAGITSFNLATSQANQDVNGNVIARNGTYVRSDGTSRGMASVNFALDEPIPVIPEGTDLGDIATLPNLSGELGLPDLKTAMFFDTVLKAMVEDLVYGDHDFDSFAEFLDGGFLDVLYRWAGIDTSVPLEAGDPPYNVQALAAFLGQSAEGLNSHQVERLGDEIWPVFLQQAGVQFLAQAAGLPSVRPFFEIGDDLAALSPDDPGYSNAVSSIFQGAIAASNAASPAYDYLDLFAGLQVNLSTGEISGDFDAVVARFIEDQPSFFTWNRGVDMPAFNSPDENLHPWTVWYRDQGSLLFAVADAMGIGSDYVKNVAGWRWLEGDGVTDHRGTDGADLLSFTVTTYEQYHSYSDWLTVAWWTTVESTNNQRLFGFEGDDELRGNDGDDRLIGGPGDDLLKGGTGSDMYVYALGDGLDRIIDDDGADDTIYFSTELNSEDLQVVRPSGTNDLLLHFGNPAAGITLTNQWSSFAAAVEHFHFVGQPGLTAGDISSLYLATLATAGADSITGSWASERLIGLDGNDSLWGVDGDDFLDGGAGNDSLYGGNHNDAVIGGGGDDLAVGELGNDTLIGGIGNDSLQGGIGGDTYVYNPGDGDDVISDYKEGDYNTDALVFGTGITPDDLIFSRVASDWDDIRITFEGQAGSILIDNQNYVHAGIEEVRFANGTIWNHAQFMAAYVADQQTAADDIIHGSRLGDTVQAGTGNDMVLAGPGNDTLIGGSGNDNLQGNLGNDTYVYNLGDGDDVIWDYEEGDYVTDTLVFGNGILPTDLIISRFGTDGYDIRITFIGQAGSIVIDNQHYVHAGIEAVQFANGISWNHAELNAAYLAGQMTSGNDTVYGSYLDETIACGVGNDTLIGGGGNDTYVWARGNGSDTINETGDYLGSNDQLRLEGINPGDVTIARSGSNITITIRESSAGAGDGGSVVLLSSLDSYRQRGPEQIIFADGTVWSQATLRQMLVNAAGTPGDDNIVGTLGADLLRGAGGNDTLAGGDGNDIYLWARGDGNDVINETTQYHGWDRVTLEGVNPAEVTIGRSGNNMFLYIAESTPGAGDGGTIQLTSSGDDIKEYGIEEVTFADGTIWYRNDIRVKWLSSVSTSGNNTIDGFNVNDTIRGGAGNDTLQGWNGNDNYIWARGDGNDVINETAQYNGWDRVTLEGVNPSSVTIGRSGNNMFLYIAESSPGAGDGGTIQLTSSGDDIKEYGIEEVVFADGTIWYRNDIRTKWLASVSTPGNNTIDGFNVNDTIRGGGGNDILQGWDGNDNYIWARGDGNDVINETAQYHGWDRVTLEGVNPSSVTIGRSGNNIFLYIAESSPGAGDGGTIQLTSSGDVIKEYGIEEVAFADGTIWYRSDIQTKWLDAVSTAGNDTIDGFNVNDTIRGGAGNDTLQGWNGNDNYIWARGDGNDVINETYQYHGWDRVTLEGVNPSSVTVGRNGNIMFLYIAESSPGAGDGGTIQLINNAEDIKQYGIEEVVFADGTIWYRNDIRLKYFEDASTAGNDAIAGFSYNDTISGEGGDDTLSGSGGNDILIGGTGVDWMDGGTGADTFRFIEGDTLLGAQADTIAGFEGGSDKIDLSAIDAQLSAFGDQGFIFLGTGAFTQQEGQLRYQIEGSNRRVQADVNGDGVADFEIVLTGTGTLMASDFVI